ncbi:uncharacterized protein LOC119884114 isoform X3 [Micropterus salmoides]|uniref:uncharacterized protein LOC119884114 isoform X3 n=1 Tax=Micropterus salmoides TaxID=27706 RepID=UPI0018ED147D|nr:uncharacterized protein LOC119884114 isoform X3 [Micropterus salmoides]
MHFKQKGYRVGVLLLIYSITAITLLSVGWCEPDVYIHNDRSSVLTTRGLSTQPSNRQGGQWLHLDSRQGEESRSLPYLRDFAENRDGTQSKTPGGGAEQTLKPTMASDQNRKKRKQTEGKWMDPPNKDCSKGEMKPVIHGEFYIIGQLEIRIPDVGDQSYSAESVQSKGGQERIRGQRVSASERSWQRLQPVVECGDDAMTLTVRRRRAVQLLLDRVNESSVPLSQLPPQCGYSVQTTWRDLSLMVHYNACDVTQEEGRYVLPLLWRGTPVKMSCPASQIQPQAVGPSSICCSPHGMTVKVQGLSVTEELGVNVRGTWTPLVMLAEQCGYTLDRQGAEIVIAAPFVTCGITVKDGKYTLSLKIGENTLSLACPISLPEELPVTRQPLVKIPHRQARGPTDHTEPFPFAPPFYLAPPNYPHPTYHHKYPSTDGHDTFNPTLSYSTSESTFGPQSPVDSQPDHQDYYAHQIPVRESYKHFGVQSSLSSTDVLEDSGLLYPDLQRTQETPVLGLSEKRSATHSPSSDSGFPIQAEAPPLHVFNQYYHYYHHPKIPLPGPPQDPVPGHEIPKEQSLTNPHNPEFPVFPPIEALSRVNSDQVPQLTPDAASHPYTLPSPEFVPKASAPHTPYPPQPYPYHYFYYFPHISSGEAKRLAPLNKGFVHPLPHSSDVHQPKPDKTNFQKNSPEWIKHPPLSDDDDVKAELDDKKNTVQPPLPPGPDAVAVPPPEQPCFPTPSFNHNLPPYPYYHYYQMYYGPESLLGTDPVSPTSSKEERDPLLQAASSPPQHPSYFKHQTTPPPTKSVYDDHNNPYYYYHLYQPIVSVDKQELHPSSSGNSEKASSKSESQLPSDYSTKDWLVHAAETGYPSIPQPLHSPFHSLYSHYISKQHPNDYFGQPAGEEAEERLDEEIGGDLKTAPYTPSASPCGLGSVSDFVGSVALGCFIYPVKDCTVGQHLIFAVPDSVVEPAVAPPVHFSEVSNVSCTLQRLTSDPDMYIIPLDGCGVNKHVFGQTAVHLVEVHGNSHSLQGHSSVHDNSPVRLLVEYSSSPGSPGEVRLHVMDQPPPLPVQSTPAIVTVQLRIATDESFTSFHPEAHLPLSLMRGRPVYVEASLLDPPEPGLVLLVHSCLAYTRAPYTSWMLIYDGFYHCVVFSCSSQGDSHQLPSPRSDRHDVRRINISSFLSLPSASPSSMAKGGYTHLEDPEIYFLCLTEVCSAADGDCTLGCISQE